jgi:5-methyltetrahydrofolate--homocysteine methyltransferase
LVLEKISIDVLNGNLNAIENTVVEALKKHRPEEIINDGLIKGMRIVGEKFKNGEYFLPEVMVSAETMHKALELLRPKLENGDYKSKCSVVFGTVRGDLHDIGKNLVAMMFVGAGFDVIDLGIDVTPDKFAEAISKYEPRLLCLSALLTTTMPEMTAVISMLEERKLRNRIKVMIGGAPITQKYADKIGADGYAPNAAEAVDKANSLLNL